MKDRKLSLTMADIGNAIEATGEAIAYVKTIIDSNLPPGSRSWKARKSWDEDYRISYTEWNEQLKRFSALRKKLLAIERAA